MERPAAEYPTIALLLLLFRITAELQRRMRRPGAWNPDNDFQRRSMRMQQQGGPNPHYEFQANQVHDQYQEEDEEHEEEEEDSDSYEEVLEEVITEPLPKRRRPWS